MTNELVLTSLCIFNAMTYLALVLNEPLRSTTDTKCPSSLSTRPLTTRSLKPLYPPFCFPLLSCQEQHWSDYVIPRYAARARWPASPCTFVRAPPTLISVIHGFPRDPWAAQEMGKREY